MVVLAAHVRTGEWASIIPETFADVLGLSEPLRSIPIVEPQEMQRIGLVLPRREPMPPLSRALLAEANHVALQDDLDA